MTCIPKSMIQWTDLYKMKKYDYLLVGAGLFNSTVGYFLNKAGKKVLIIEKRDHIGGNIYTKNENGIDIHVYGAHIFHTTEKEVWDFVNSLDRFLPYNHTVDANYKGEIYSLPFNMYTFSKVFGTNSAEEVAKIIDKERKEYGVSEPKNLEEKAISLVGKTIYNLLVKNYTEKQWGRPCTELPPFIISRLPFRLTFDNNYFNDPYQGMPEHGYTRIIEKLLEGIEVKLGIDYLKEKDYYNSLAENIIYSGQVDALFDYQLGDLEYRSIRFENEWLDVPKFQGKAVINYTDGDTKFTRIIEHSHFLKQYGDKTLISKEYSSSYKRGGEPYYPVNNDKNNLLYSKYVDLANQNKHLFLGGRLGLYKYLDMDDTIIEAFKLLDKLGIKR